VNLAKGRLQQTFPCALWIAELPLLRVTTQHTDKYVC
jgi:hypothetical protein